MRKYYIVVTPFFPTVDKPYLGNYVYDQVKAVSQLTGLTPVVFSPLFPEGQLSSVGEISTTGLVVKSLPSYLFNGICGRRNGKRFLARLAATGIDPSEIYAVHAHTVQYAPMALALKETDSQIKTILHHHDLDPLMVCHGRLASLWPNLLYRAMKSRKSIEAIDLNVAVSNAALDRLLRFPSKDSSDPYLPYRHREKSLVLRHFRSPRPQSAIVVNNGVDTEKFSPGRPTAPADRFTIGIIANYQRLKGHATLLKAIDILLKRGYDRLRLLSVGCWPESGYREFKQLVADMNLTDIVETVDHIDHDRLRSFYLGLDLYVMPSIFEGFGCVYAEAAACGVSFIGIKGQGVADLVRDEDAERLLALPDDPVDLADKIERFILSPDRFKPARPIDILSTTRRLVDAIKQI